MIFILEIIATILILIIRSVYIFANIVKEIVEIGKTALFLLDFVDSLKDAIHSLPVYSVVKLVKIYIVENTEIEKDWREDPSGSGDRNQYSQYI
jgi:hypothetical protein